MESTFYTFIVIVLFLNASFSLINKLERLYFHLQPLSLTPSSLSPTFSLTLSFSIIFLLLPHSLYTLLTYSNSLPRKYLPISSFLILNGSLFHSSLFISLSLSSSFKTLFLSFCPYFFFPPSLFSLRTNTSENKYTIRLSLFYIHTSSISLFLLPSTLSISHTHMNSSSHTLLILIWVLFLITIIWKTLPIKIKVPLP